MNKMKKMKLVVTFSATFSALPKKGKFLAQIFHKVLKNGMHFC